MTCQTGSNNSCNNTGKVMFTLQEQLCTYKEILLLCLCVCVCEHACARVCVFNSESYPSIKLLCMVN